MAPHRQPVRAGKPRRPRTHHGDALAGRRGTLERMHARRHQTVGGVALQRADLHRLALGRLAHAGLLAERLDRADPRAHAAEDVLLEDRPRRRLGLARLNLPDEQRDVDFGRAGGDAGRVIAEVAPVGRHPRLMHAHRRMQVAEVPGIGLGRQPTGDDAGGRRAVGHEGAPCPVGSKLATARNFIKRSIFDPASERAHCQGYAPAGSFSERRGSGMQAQTTGRKAEEIRREG